MLPRSHGLTYSCHRMSYSARLLACLLALARHRSAAAAAPAWRLGRRGWWVLPLRAAAQCAAGRQKNHTLHREQRAEELISMRVRLHMRCMLQLTQL